jgi:hypothetical protein
MRLYAVFVTTGKDVKEPGGPSVSEWRRELSRYEPRHTCHSHAASCSFYVCSRKCREWREIEIGGQNVRNPSKRQQLAKFDLAVRRLSYFGSFALISSELLPMTPAE